MRRGAMIHLASCLAHMGSRNSRSGAEIEPSSRMVAGSQVCRTLRRLRLKRRIIPTSQSIDLDCPQSGSVTRSSACTCRPPLLSVWAKLCGISLTQIAKPGGATANVAYQAAQLGARGVVASRVGTDELGQELTRYLVQKGLDITWLQTDSEHEPGRSLSMPPIPGTDLRDPPAR